MADLLDDIIRKVDRAAVERTSRAFSDVKDPALRDALVRDALRQQAGAPLAEPVYVPHPNPERAPIVTVRDIDWMFSGEYEDHMPCPPLTREEQAAVDAYHGPWEPEPSALSKRYGHVWAEHGGFDAFLDKVLAGDFD